jgi:hypothetical protein
LEDATVLLVLAVGAWSVVAILVWLVVQVRVLLS